MLTDDDVLIDLGMVLMSIPARLVSAPRSLMEPHPKGEDYPWTPGSALTEYLLRERYQGDGHVFPRMRLTIGVKDLYHAGLCACCGCEMVAVYRRGPLLSVCSKRCKVELEKQRQREKSAAYRALVPPASHDKLCACCSEPFQAKRSDAKFCSTACRVAAHRASPIPQPSNK